MSIFELGSTETVITDADMETYLDRILKKLLKPGMKSILLLPPDHTRLYSGAGQITAMLYKMLSSDYAVDVMPALGTHVPMDESEIHMMFGT
ncbi:MAG: DUF2088 domain-containing protein, partial [Planctomycetes bacterium]|nr:DUF2088 domain-containing protein [Planctomycetota bacterium]